MIQLPKDAEGKSIPLDTEELCEIYDEELAEYEDEHGIDHS